MKQMHYISRDELTLLIRTGQRLCLDATIAGRVDKRLTSLMQQLNEAHARNGLVTLTRRNRKTLQAVRYASL